MITDRETSAVCLTAPSCGCLGDDCRLTEVHIPQLLPLSAALCFALTQCILGDDHLWWFFFFLNWTVSRQIHIVFMYMKSYFHSYKNWTSEGPINPTKAVKSADTSLYWLITSHLSCLFMFYSLHCGQRESYVLSFSGVCLEPSTDCFWMGWGMLFYVHITHYVKPQYKCTAFFISVNLGLDFFF